MTVPGDELTYVTYLKVPQLLDLQELRSDPPHPEELHFIVVHQALELWFKLLLHDLERLIARIDADDWAGAMVLLRRVNDVMATGLEQMRSLHDMPPASFHEFRSYLGSASGLQSVQFRELELLSGLREDTYLASLRAFTAGDAADEASSTGGAQLPAALQRRLDGRSLADAHAEAAQRIGITDWAAFYRDPGGQGAFYLLCEALVDYDERWIRWRNEHVTLVERSIGQRARGTAGTALTYLKRTTAYRYFPQLWDLRSDLAEAAGGELVDRG